MDCPNDRYVNDAAICQAVVGMLARIGVKVNLNAQPKGAVFRQGAEVRRLQDLVLSARLDARHQDSHNVLTTSWAAATIPEPRAAPSNLGGYCNKQLDALTDKVLSRPTRQARCHDQGGVMRSPIKEFGYIPLHQQALAWGVSKKVKLCSAPTTRCCHTTP
jgi:peptide/nickel transport system substrate-binding protein